MLHFSKEIINKSKPHRAWAEQFAGSRDFFANSEIMLAEYEGHSRAAVDRFMANEAALLPTDAWREVDAITLRVMRSDGGRPYMDDLMPLARAVDIGKLVHITRVASDMNATVMRSMSGQVAVPMDKTDYAFQGAPIPLFDAGYGREWREWNTLRSENFDALADDQESATWHLRHNMADFILNGDPRIKVKDYTAYGIRNNPASKAINLGSAAGGAGIDLTTADPTEVESFFNTVLGGMLDDNYLTSERVNLYVSPEIGRNFDRPYSGVGGFKVGTLWENLLKNRRIAKIAVTFDLTGNEFIAFVPDSRFIQPLVGQAVGTTAIPRTLPRSNYQFQVSGALGLQVKTDANGRGGVFYSVTQN